MAIVRKLNCHTLYCLQIRIYGKKDEKTVKYAVYSNLKTMDSKIFFQIFAPDTRYRQVFFCFID